MLVLNVVLIGISIVFLGLVCLIAIINIMHFYYERFSKQKPVAGADPTGDTTNTRLSSVRAKDTQPSAAMQTDLNAAPHKLNIQGDRGQFVAAISAAIAAQIGSDVSGLRIHSIRKVDVQEDRGQLVAAVSAAIAAHIGSDVSGLNVHSIQRV